MATDGKATWWNASSGSPAYSAQELRQIDALEVMPGPASEPFSGRPGRRVNNSGLVVSVSSTGDGSVSVSAGVCLLYASSQAVQGVWRAQFPAIGPIALTARPASGFSRIVLVLARLYDSDSSIGSVKEAKIEILTGSNSSGTPVAPTIPAAWVALELDRLTVTSSGTITHVQSTQRTVAAGGILPVATVAERDALKTAGIAYEGLFVHVAATGSLDKYDGTNWVPSISGDTGWNTSVSYGSGWSGFGGGTALRKIGKNVTLILYAAKASFAVGETILTVPASFAPDRLTPMTFANGGAIRTAYLDTSGALIVDVASTSGMYGSASYVAAS